MSGEGAPQSGIGTPLLVLPRARVMLPQQADPPTLRCPGPEYRRLRRGLPDLWSSPLAPRGLAVRLPSGIKVLGVREWVNQLTEAA